MDIGLFTSVFFNNIGNGFIDLGAEETIKAAMPTESTLIKVSQCANFAASMGRTFTLKENPAVNWVWVHTMQKLAKKAHDRAYQAVDTKDVFSILKIISLDALIIPGCVLTVPFFTIYGKLLEDKVAEGCKIIFLGASGNYYTEYETEFVAAQLKKIRPFAIMTRDSVAYKKYHDLAEHSYNGIDNVFFVNRIGLPKIKTNITPYAVVNIEEPRHQEIKNEICAKLNVEGKHIVYSYHKPFPYERVIKLSKQKDMMISDYPLDYLHLYNNACEVYSDRVHACIPTLSFGNQAMLYSDSPRTLLFDNVGITSIKQQLTRADGLLGHQEKQIQYLHQVLQAL